MSEITVTVKDLAKTINVSTDKLLGQLRDAGIVVADENHPITAVEKAKLLEYLRGGSVAAGGAREGAAAISVAEEGPKRITLKRKKVSELPASAGTGTDRAKKVKVEVRKKRTYVKQTGIPAESEESVELPEELENMGSEAPDLSDNKVMEAEPAVTSVVSDQADISSTASLTPEEKVEKEAPVNLDQESDSGDKTPSSSKKPAPAVVEKTELGRERDQDKKHAARRQQSEFEKKISRSKISVTTNFEDEDGGDGARRRRKKPKKSQSGSDLLSQHNFEKPTQPVVKEVEISTTIVVAELAKRLHVKVADLVKVLFKLGVLVTINQIIDQDTAILAVEELGHKAIAINVNAKEDALIIDESHYSQVMPRAPVVTVMGHVDHGKTSLLDYIRRTKVTMGEAGGITQHIGAYHVSTDRGMISFVDTPGHEAFTAMRARGAKVTDIVILVVAADDGVMPQTIEAIQHAKAANVPVIVAVNKMDKPDADPDRVKMELSQHNVLTEDWGGETMFMPISAKTGQGIDELLEAILIQSEMLELKAPTVGPARGTVVEARIDKGRGAVITVLVQKGTLRKGDILVAGEAFCRVRALLDEAGNMVDSAGPSVPVEVLGFSSLPAAGDDALVLSDEKQARDIIDHRTHKKREVRFLEQRTSQRDVLFRDLGSNISYLPVLIKADVQGSLEALSESLKKLSTDEVKVKIISLGIGGITESDVYLAQASKAMIIGFNVRADAKARLIIEREGIALHYYSVIYDVMKDVEGLMSSMLAPERQQKILGLAEVRDVFRSPKFGAIAGCMVIEGTVKRHFAIRVLRDNVVIYEGQLESLRRFKEDVSEVRNGMECGIGVKNYNDVKVGDQIEVYEVIEVSRDIRSSKLTS
jgi:translation initiation factor IF-2